MKILKELDFVSVTTVFTGSPQLARGTPAVNPNPAKVVCLATPLALPATGLTL